METTHESSRQTLRSAQPSRPYAFSRKVFCEGMRDGVPIALGYFAVSFSLGIAARTAGFTPLQGFVASLLNNASAGEYAAFAEKAIALGKQGAARRKSVREGGVLAAIECLSPKEEKIARLAAERATNREIAEKLFLSEGTVKQYINQIYSKLGIEGDTRTKRGALAALLGKN